jgi:hypothetical protein
MSRTIAILMMTMLGATTASAHPRLQTSNPAAGATLKAAPKDIRLSFNEGLVPSFTGLELKNANGKPVPTGKAMLVPGDNKKIVVPIGTRLTAGTYNVAWHAVSVDTHRVSGSYSFKVKR